MKEYQLIVIGAGPGGYVAALRAAKLGMTVAVVENREAGGTCLNRGCIPTKTLLHSSEAYHAATASAGIGIHVEGARADMGEIFAYKRQISAKLSSGIESLFKGAKIDLIRGRAQITAPGRVHVELNEGGCDELAAEKIIAATGSVPARPPITGLDLPGVMTSDELLEGCDHLYESIIIIGGGVIGIEFATFYSDLGCKVTVIEGMDRLLPNMDRELGQNLAMILKKQGVNVFVNSMVQCVEKDESGFTVRFSEKGKDNSATGEAVLCAIGRKPYMDGLFAEGLAHKGKREVSDQHTRRVRHRRRIREDSACPRCLRTGYSMRRYDERHREQRGYERCAQRHILPARDSGGGNDGGRGQGSGNTFKSRQMRNVWQRQNAYRRSGPLLYEGRSQCRDPRDNRRTAHVRAQL